MTDIDPADHEHLTRLLEEALELADHLDMRLIGIALNEALAHLDGVGKMPLH